MGAAQQKAFTLVELITVIMVLGILSIGTVRFITDSSKGFASTIARSQLAGDARFAVERISISMRDALPNSVRVAGPCIEFIPTLAATTYTTLPTAVAAGSFRAVPFDPAVIPAGARAAVYPSAAIYNEGNPGEISPAVVVSAPDAANEITVSLPMPHQFTSESPSKRVFLVAEPVSYCVDGERLWRYQGYGFSSVQPGLAVLPGARPDRTLIAEHVNAAAPFSVSTATLTRNAIVQIEVEFARGGDSVSIEDTIQVRNVP